MIGIGLKQKTSLTWIFGELCYFYLSVIKHELLKIGIKKTIYSNIVFLFFQKIKII